MTETTAAAAAAPAGSPAKAPAKVGKGAMAGIVASAVVAAIGIALWFVQMSGGMVQTGMRNLDSWGLYITMFMFFVGLSAGGLIISSVPKAFGIKGFGGISKVAVMTSIAATVGAIGFVVVDMGQPLRVWELFVYSNLGSPLMWDIIVLMVYLILSCVYLWAQIAAEKGKVSHTALRVISVVALVCAVLVHSVTAWIFGLQQSHEMWHTALLAPWFVSSALVCGAGLVICAAVALRAAGYLQWDQADLVKLAKLLAVFLLVDLYFFGCDLLTEAFPAASGAEIVAMLVSGPLAPFFWGEIILSVLAVIICVVPQLRTSPLLVAAGLFAIAAIFCKRVQLLVGGFQVANIDWPAVLTPYTVTDWQGNMATAYQGMVYWPTPLELGIALGVVGLSFLIFFLGLKLLPLRPAGRE
ncbi:molybdopterin-containing oxidoreductase family membrane subunit [Parvibacter caecicola]|uniref:Molybdopterin-containing oxidoreductase family membrane subunit n=3 Tax=Parvibacter caecicola TaxID=747645 RepID=A0A7W5D243_9ACTN|nr:NrfD/PsrC family molybdoenzyme membrane anchor subunit [Parvibacter caecicola]MBB3171499.1 molybdopterin-containing oxidoreductase family membrane subunit [Parvibacter caecicola]MCR2040759.1 polysulfide reductase NrfD [Parvibacter caecicola]